MPKGPISIEFLRFGTHFLAKIHVSIANLGLNGMLSTLGDLFFQGGVNFVAHIRIFLVINLRKVHFILNYNQIQRLLFQQL